MSILIFRRIHCLRPEVHPSAKQSPCSRRYSSFPWRMWRGSRCALETSSARRTVEGNPPSACIEQYVNSWYSYFSTPSLAKYQHQIAIYSIHVYEICSQVCSASVVLPSRQVVSAKIHRTLISPRFRYPTHAPFYASSPSLLDLPPVVLLPPPLDQCLLLARGHAQINPGPFVLPDLIPCLL